jgi:hypothetical protein
MMNGMMNSSMMEGMGVIGIIILIVVFLAIAALAKYVFFR